MDKLKLYTFGYTLFQNGNDIDIKNLFSILQQFNITHLVDVRSIPYSRQYPSCNADNLKLAGAYFSISYIHIPELGAKASPSQDVFSKASDIFFENIFPISKSNRPENIAINSDDKIVDFKKLRNDDFFLNGIRRIETAYNKNYTLAIMCSEKNPVECHRYFLISNIIEQKFGDMIEVQHIIKPSNSDSSIISNKEIGMHLNKIVLNKMEIKKLNIFNHTLLEPAIIDKYCGNTLEEKINDFCDRYWNLLHGWKMDIVKQTYDGEYYDTI